MGLSRSDTILKYIVEYFIKNAEPLGSQTLIDEYHLPYSSATIRNEMVVLEQQGFIEKTHSSSGRIPSSKGYRYYCEHLRDNAVSDEFKNAVQTVLDNKMKSIEEVIKASCEILSHMTSLVSVVTGDAEEEKLASVQLIQISNNAITAVFVTDRGYVENKTFIVPEHMSGEDLVGCVKILNERLKGTPISELVEKTEAIKPVLSDYVVSHDVVYQALLETFVRFASDRMSLYGREELFNHAEYQNDVEKLRKVMGLLNDASLFRNSSTAGKTSVNIGGVKDNPDVTIVQGKVDLGSEGETTISLLGPTRIDYDKTLSAMEYIVQALNEYFKGNGGNSDDNGGNDNGGGDA